MGNFGYYIFCIIALVVVFFYLEENSRLSNEDTCSCRIGRRACSFVFSCV